MKCKKCNSQDIKVWVVIEMYIDVENFGKLTKRVINKKSTELWGMDYSKTKFVCRDCCFAW